MQDIVTWVVLKKHIRFLKNCRNAESCRDYVVPCDFLLSFALQVPIHRVYKLISKMEDKICKKWFKKINGVGGRWLRSKHIVDFLSKYKIKSIDTFRDFFESFFLFCSDF